MRLILLIVRSISLRRVKTNIMEDRKIFFIAALVAILLFIGLIFLQELASNIVYNDGICVKCGGRYVYQQAVGHRYNTRYIYQCDKCGKLIEINSIH